MRISDWSSDVCSSDLWARGGSAVLVTPKALDGPLTQPGPAYGDTIGGMNIAGGIAAALFHRERTGEATEVDVSLLSSGIWATACSVDVAMELDKDPFENLLPGGGQAVGTNPFMRSEEHTSELQSLMRLSYAVFCLK